MKSLHEVKNAALDAKQPITTRNEGATGAQRFASRLIKFCE